MYHHVNKITKKIDTKVIDDLQVHFENLKGTKIQIRLKICFAMNMSKINRTELKNFINQIDINIGI